ncbi:copper resistance CopC family protein [Cochlodiniinecator piscidefendens]|uniref:copper resistance CopC family protein n=1 Tax=Cochlodiniinecator piscidefendens TaxID=2715756 RepID=UPI00140BB4F5|nr:copper resistance CopC family protein [Cochlodiniinecator piscidefendens]
MKIFLSLALCLILATPILAHSPLRHTTPEDGERLSMPPEEIVMKFGSDIRLTLVQLVYQNDTAIPLDMSGATEFATNFSFPANTLNAGLYVVEWRGLGADGHILDGAFEFTVE